MKDLVVLVADRDAKAVLESLLPRSKSLGIREICFQVYAHSERDPGCFLRCHDFLRCFQAKYSQALVLFDKEGCGREDMSRMEIEKEVEIRLSQSGWKDRSRAIVLDPELEAWVWSGSPHVESVLGWRGSRAPMEDWIRKRGFLAKRQVKPSRPKETMEAILHEVRTHSSSALFQHMAEIVSFKKCTDPAFLKLLEVLRGWFGTS